MVDGRSGIEVLDRDQCLALLETDVVGRLAVVAGGAPAVFPVNYAMDSDAVVFRTAPGTKLDAGCFEIDFFDRDRRTGWSVVVSGRLEEVTAFDGSLSERVKALAVDPWAEGEKEHWLRLVPHVITGRSVGPPP
jgi:uncharacterized protein